MTASFPQFRPRRLRQSSMIRDMVRETTIHPNNLIMPLFIKAGENIKHPIASMPGMFQFSIDTLADEIKSIRDCGLQSVLLFGVPESSQKDALGSCGFAQDGIIAKSIQLIKEFAPTLQVITDICCCEYTHHGHCGIIQKDDKTGNVDNDKTLALYAKQAQAHAQAGADIVAPSGMMDGQITAIRYALDDIGFQHIPIMSYSVKYASSLYGPFRDAAEGTPKFGDRKTYQMDIANKYEALKEAEQDIQEGADILMVKPAGMYLDVIQQIKQKYPHYPLAAYQVSGEYAMIKAASQNGWLNEIAVMHESLLAIKRAGADIIISYFAKEFSKLKFG